MEGERLTGADSRQGFRGRKGDEATRVGPSRGSLEAIWGTGSRSLAVLGSRTTGAGCRLDAPSARSATRPGSGPSRRWPGGLRPAG
jgi:hypothetical protein